MDNTINNRGRSDAVEITDDTQPLVDGQRSGSGRANKCSHFMLWFLSLGLLAGLVVLAVQESTWSHNSDKEALQLKQRIGTLEEEVDQLNLEDRTLEEEVDQVQQIIGTLNTTLEEEVNQLKHRIETQEKVVSFYAYTLDFMGSPANITYEHVEINENGGYPSGGYNKTDGSFTVPVTGIYHFEVSGVSYDTQYPLLCLRKQQGPVDYCFKV